MDEPVPMVDPDPCGGPRNPACIREFVVRRSNEGADTTDHSVGLGLEVAVVPFRNVRPIRVSLDDAVRRFRWRRNLLGHARRLQHQGRGRAAI
ncbi:MAG: hypothetical protein JRD03_11880 [Deltaproteobacteria bacterium]|nr:hypothetical protein [Deltaproteobacteria bacterium]